MLEIKKNFFQILKVFILKLLKASITKLIWTKTQKIYFYYFLSIENMNLLFYS